MDILETCQGLMKMVECMEDNCLSCPKGEIKSKVTHKKVDPNNRSKGCIKWGQGNRGLKETVVSKKQEVDGQGIASKEGKTRLVQGQVFQL
jgi:hypothetical protein